MCERSQHGFEAISAIKVVYNDVFIVTKDNRPTYNSQPKFQPHTNQTLTLAMTLISLVKLIYWFHNVITAADLSASKHVLVSRQTPTIQSTSINGLPLLCCYLYTLTHAVTCYSYRDILCEFMDRVKIMCTNMIQFWILCYKQTCLHLYAYAWLDRYLM